MSEAAPCLAGPSCNRTSMPSCNPPRDKSSHNNQDADTCRTNKRQRASGWPIIGCPEVFGYYLADHQITSSTKQLGSDPITRSQYETEAKSCPNGESHFGQHNSQSRRDSA